MKVLAEYYNKFRKHRQEEIQRIARSEVILNTIRESSLSNTRSLIAEGKKGRNIIVSLTTFGLRIQSVYLALESIARQTQKPDKIVLWLSESQFNPDNIPITLKRLTERGLSIEFRNDIGPHTKLVYALKEFSDSIIISVDDDMIYPIDLIENLYNTYLENPDCICCNLARRITKQNDKYLSYRKWDYIFKKAEKSMDLLPLGVNGVLYFPNCFDDEVFNIETIKAYSQYADDLWFKIMALKNNTSTVLTGCYPFYTNDFIPLDSSFINPLGIKNIIDGKNDVQFENLVKVYKISL